MIDNLNVLEKCNCRDEETLKFAYARALMYLCGAIVESDYAGKEQLFYKKAKEMLDKINPAVIKDDFNARDRKNYLQYKSPLNNLYENRKKF